MYQMLHIQKQINDCKKQFDEYHMLHIQKQKDLQKQLDDYKIQTEPQNRINKEIFNAVFEDLKGYESLYKISKHGEIWSNWYSKVLTPTIDELGYANINLTKDTIKHHSYLHRLLAIQFIPNPDDKPFIDHIDRNPSNNSLSNLRWATHTENMNNKKDNIALLTPAEMEEHKEKEMEYQRNYQRAYCEKKRREAGCQKRSEMVKTKSETYQKDLYASKTEEEKEKLRARGRELYYESGQERQREYISRPEVNQKRMEDQRKKRAEKTPEQKEKEAKRRKELYDAKKQAKLTNV